ncbi:uncharacterized protein LOC131666254 [Phymastichus coffea]|uniref:uncharacterized protein LOC131666254 n=1 Tax=Phymastichus coffea TaxID=108790 RepID=UPI00273AD2E2|nr:uncharacterized protein LOC131666254 [Phymastichus coffea]XP_058794745.1 uncharacterized protein LOC131666254 [Phymastichus coffea]XP_058794746.1 uncharacterized protein LOC131666254 [Phymastichus coffea]XP_058794747.1 uncharacterized protein LOC131666254 [Phymastichus coffea]
MDDNMQAGLDILNKNEAENAIENEHVNKKPKLCQSTDENLKLGTDISKNESKDIEMPLAEENQSKPCSSTQNTQETSERMLTVSFSESSKYKPDSFKTGDDSDKDDNELPASQYEAKKGFNYPLESDASDMLDEVDAIQDGRFPTVTERYLTPYYQLDITQPGDDVCILIHSNRICMFTLAPSHIIYQKNKKIVKCDYQVSEKLNRLRNKVSGKAKHGAQPLQNNSNLCRLTCDDGSIYVVKCCIIGKLVEVNERLVEDPELLKQLPHDGGYIAIALPNLKHLDKIKSKLLDQKSYEEALKERKERIEKEKNKLNDNLVLDDEKELKNEHNNHVESVESKEQIEISNINNCQTKIDMMEVVEL